MLWFPFALFSAIVLASRRVYEKNLTNAFGNFSMGFIVQAFSLLPTLALFLFLPLPDNILTLPWRFWWPLLIIWFILYPIQTYFLYRALREGELSETTPIMALLPVFNIFSSYIIIGELPTLLGGIGIISVVFGTYLLLKNPRQSAAAKYSQAVLYMIIAATCIAIGSTLDKVSISVSTPVFYSFMNTLGASVIFLFLIYIYKQQEELKKIKIMVWPLVVLGIFQALSYTASMFAFSYGPTSYVLAVRSGSFLIASAVGIFFLKEVLSSQKIISYVLFVAGIVLITAG